MVFHAVGNKIAVASIAHYPLFAYKNLFRYMKSVARCERTTSRVSPGS